MIIQALRELAEREELVNDPDFPLGNVSWSVAVSRDGRIVGITDLREMEPTAGKKKPRLVARSIPVPYQAARSGTKARPYFLVDNAKYVFGRTTADKKFKPGEGAEKSGWFRELVSVCAQETGDPGVQAVRSALESVATGVQSVELPADCKSNDLFAFVYEPDVDVYVHQRPAVRDYWRAQRRTADVTDAAFNCMVSGESIPDPGNFPKIKKVPGGQSSGASLVSFNAAAFESYGLRGNENAPIGRDVAESAAKALERLVDPGFPDPRPGHHAGPMSRRQVRIAEDTLVCYWSNSSAAESFLDVVGSLLDASDPAEVGEMYRSLWSGRPAKINDAGAFYALTLSGAQGRVIVRDWFETTVARVGQNLARHFDDLAIVRNTPQPKGRALPEHLQLNLLLSALAPFGKRENIPDALAAAFVRAALQGTAYPYSILQRAVERARAEATRADWPDMARRDARGALIKAVLRRTLNRQITTDMDPTNTNPGYLCGRLMAVIERLQQVAVGDVNASVVDRYFGAASATPRAVFVRLLRGAQNHARKAQDDPKAKGTARWLKRQIDEISDRFDPKHNGFPAFLHLEDQGMFVLGYHQQRHALWQKRDSSDEVEAALVPGDNTKTTISIPAA